MKLETVNRNYQSLNKGIRYSTTCGRDSISIVIDQLQSGTIYLDLKSAKILLAELEHLIHEAETERTDNFESRHIFAEE